MTKIQLNLNDYSGDIEKRLNYTLPTDIDSAFSDSFIECHTKHKTFFEFCKTIDLNIFSNEDLDALQNGKFDNVICQHSDFKSWKNMIEGAIQALINEK